MAVHWAIKHNVPLVPHTIHDLHTRHSLSVLGLSRWTLSDQRPVSTRRPWLPLLNPLFSLLWLTGLFRYTPCMHMHATLIAGTTVSPDLRQPFNLCSMQATFSSRRAHLQRGCKLMLEPWSNYILHDRQCPTWPFKCWDANEPTRSTIMDVILEKMTWCLFGSASASCKSQDVGKCSTCSADILASAHSHTHAQGRVHEYGLSAPISSNCMVFQVHTSWWAVAASSIGWCTYLEDKTLLEAFSILY